MIHYALTLALVGQRIYVGEAWEAWSVVEVAPDGSVLLVRDEPYTSHGDFIGCAQYRWFPGSVLERAIADIRDRLLGWDDS